MTDDSSRKVSRGLRGPERGAAAVEFALVLPLLTMFLLGIVTFGLAYSDHLALTNTVREGSRFGSSTDNTTNWDDAVVARTVQLYANADNPLPSANVCAMLIKKVDATTFTPLQSSNTNCASGSTAAGAAPPAPASIPDGSCFVKVWASLPANLNWAVAKAAVTLRAQSVSAYDRTQSCP